MATARYPKATFFVQRHLFSGLTSFAELESKIAALPDEQSRGAAFEVFAEAYLATQRKYDAAQVWPHDLVPLDILKNLASRNKTRAWTACCKLCSASSTHIKSSSAPAARR
jgi:hypothetical protein